ncbi:MAG: hypothetical protein ACKVYV_03040 [Limisphaerales bacterium]
MNVRTWLILSVAVNALAVPAAWIAWSRAKAPAPAAVLTPEAAEPVMTAAPAEPPPPAKAIPAAPAGKAFDWRQVESSDYRRYIANLRAVGCPEETIRDIIVADVGKLFAERAKQLAPARKKFEYWKTGMNVFAEAMPDPGQLRQRQALNQEKRALLKELLGVDIAEKPEEIVAAMMNPFDSMLDFLPAEKRARLLELEQEFGARQAKMFTGGHMDEEDGKAMRDLNREKREVIRGLLSPEEFADYELRMSETAMQMRFSLNGFEPTEDEFRRVFELRRGFDEEFGPMFGGADEEQMQARNEAQAKLNEGLKQLLGEERYADYERVQDFAWQSLSKVAERQGLDDAGARALWEVKQAAEAEAGRIRGDAALSAEQRTAALAAIQQETERELTARLGEKGLGSLRKNHGGYWLNNLSDRPAAAAGTVPPGVQVIVAPPGGPAGGDVVLVNEDVTAGDEAPDGALTQPVPPPNP